MEGSEAYSFSFLQTMLVSKPRHLKEIRETELFTIVPIQLPLKYSTSRSMYCRSEEEAQTLDNLFLLSGSFHSPDSRQLWIFSISRGFFIPFFYQIVLACYDRTRRYSQHHGSKHDTLLLLPPFVYRCVDTTTRKSPSSAQKPVIKSTAAGRYTRQQAKSHCTQKQATERQQVLEDPADLSLGSSSIILLP